MALELDSSLTVDAGGAEPGHDTVSHLTPTDPVLLPGGGTKKHRGQAGQDTAWTARDWCLVTGM